MISSFGDIAPETQATYKVPRLFRVTEAASLLGREIISVVDNEKEQEWIEKYREALIHAMPGKKSRLKRVLKASARILTAPFRKISNQPANIKPGNLPKKSLSETPSPEHQQKKKTG